MEAGVSVSASKSLNNIPKTINSTLLDWSDVDQHCVYSRQRVLDSALKDIDIPGIVLENDNHSNITACADNISLL